MPSIVPLKIPEITVIVIDHVAHDLTRLALEDTLAQIEPQETLVFSDREILARPGVRWIRTETASRPSAMQILWRDAPQHARTSHLLHIEWDGWVLDASFWNREWLAYDYIGAPWPWHRDGYRVGNGGFSLRSVKLMRYLCENGFYPPAHPEDDTLCRYYRPALEPLGFRWAPEPVAARFSLEHGETRRTFGFHDCRNWVRLLPYERVLQRVALGNRNAYLCAHPSWKEIL